MGLKTYGTMAVDWEERINFERLRTERLQRAKDALEKSEMGSLLCFDMNNVRDITLVATSSMVQVALGAAALLESIGVSAEVVDPRTTWPLDEATIVDSAKKTSRAIVIDEGYGRYGVAAEIAAVIAHGAFYNLDAPVTRLAAMHVPIPFSPPLEDATVPTERAVYDAARKILNIAD